MADDGTDNAAADEQTEPIAPAEPEQQQQQQQQQDDSSNKDAADAEAADTATQTPLKTLELLAKLKQPPMMWFSPSLDLEVVGYWLQLEMMIRGAETTLPIQWQFLSLQIKVLDAAILLFTRLEDSASYFKADFVTTVTTELSSNKLSLRRAWQVELRKPINMLVQSTVGQTDSIIICRLMTSLNRMGWEYIDWPSTPPLPVFLTTMIKADTRMAVVACESLFEIFGTSFRTHGQAILQSHVVDLLVEQINQRDVARRTAALKCLGTVGNPGPQNVLCAEMFECGILDALDGIFIESQSIATVLEIFNVIKGMIRHFQDNCMRILHPVIKKTVAVIAHKDRGLAQASFKAIREAILAANHAVPERDILPTL
eukprot:jgi/Hompol1/3926/HPOL_000723-RA